MFALLDRELIVFDLEYTDPPDMNTVPEIYELGAIKVTSELDEIDMFVMHVDPGPVWEGDCTFGHETEYRRLQDTDKWEDCWRIWAEFTNYNRTKLVGWFVHNDIRVMKHAYSSRSLGYPHNQSCMDIASMAYVIFSYLGVKTGGWSLKAVCNRLHIESPDHTALGDCRATLEILRKLVDFEKEFLGEMEDDTR